MSSVLSEQTIGSTLNASANTAAVKTLAGVASQRHHLRYAWWSYSGTPTGGKLTITGLEGDNFEIDITAGGPGALPLPPLSGEVGADVVATLAAGGAGVVGKVGVVYVTGPSWPVLR